MNQPKLTQRLAGLPRVIEQSPRSTAIYCFIKKFTTKNHGKVREIPSSLNFTSRNAPYLLRLTAVHTLYLVPVVRLGLKRDEPVPYRFNRNRWC